MVSKHSLTHIVSANLCFLADIARLVPRLEIGDPDAVGYGVGHGAKVKDDPDAQYLDE